MPDSRRRGAGSPMNVRRVPILLFATQLGPVDVLREGDLLSVPLRGGCGGREEVVKQGQ